MGVDVLAEPFYEWIVDVSQVKGDRTNISGVTYVKDPLPYIERKLLAVNTGHSAIAYLGYACGKATIYEALKDDSVHEAASKAVEEIGLLLAWEYGFDQEKLRAHRQKVLTRFCNPRTSGDVSWVARAPIRKLGHDERFVSPALRLLELGYRPVRLARVISVVLRYEDPEDEQAVELQGTICAEGERLALARYAGIGADHPLVDLVVEWLDRTWRECRT